jgi:hypothetical protein
LSGHGNFKPNAFKLVPIPFVSDSNVLFSLSSKVCQHDRVIVDVENDLMTESTTVHWHGQHQKGTPYMDGTPFVTQCPIPPETTFR